MSPAYGRGPRDLRRETRCDEAHISADVVEALARFRPAAFFGFRTRFR
jgi:hypothetical protein